MKNYIQKGDTVSVPAPKDVKSGGSVLVGSLFGIAQHDADAGDYVQIKRTGVFTMPKASGGALAVGDPVFWDGAASKVTATSTGNHRIGCALSDVVAASISCEVVLI